MRWWFLIAVGTHASAGFTAEKPVAPTPEKQAEIRATLRRATWNDIRKSDSASTLAYSKKLAVAAEESIDSDSRYVLWVDSAAKAIRGGEIEPAVRAVREIDRQYRDAGPASLLTTLFVENLGAHERRPQYCCLAEAELAEKSSADSAELAAKWKQFGDWIPSDQRVVAYRRSWSWATTALDSGEVKGLDRLKMSQLYRELASGIEAADAKAGRFSLYTGTWRVRFDSSNTREYVVAADGKVTPPAEAPPANPLSKVVGSLSSELGLQRTPTYRLVRRFGSIVVMSDEKKVIEGWKLDGDELVVTRFDPAVHTPLKHTASGTGLHVRETQLTAGK